MEEVAPKDKRFLFVGRVPFATYVHCALLWKHLFHDNSDHSPG